MADGNVNGFEKSFAFEIPTYVSGATKSNINHVYLTIIRNYLMEHRVLSTEVIKKYLFGGPATRAKLQNPSCTPPPLKFGYTHEADYWSSTIISDPPSSSPATRKKSCQIPIRRHQMPRLSPQSRWSVTSINFVTGVYQVTHRQMIEDARWTTLVLYAK